MTPPGQFYARRSRRLPGFRLPCSVATYGAVTATLLDRPFAREGQAGVSALSPKPQHSTCLRLSTIRSVSKLDYPAGNVGHLCKYITFVPVKALTRGMIGIGEQLGPISGAVVLSAQPTQRQQDAQF